jgi:hypothetical protein
MHWKDARAIGETEQRLYGLDAWRESPYYTDRERAALEWTESVTLISNAHAPDEAFAAVQAQFSEKEIVDLTYAISAINSWNRIAISFRAVPGRYQPRQKSSAAGCGLIFPEAPHLFFHLRSQRPASEGRPRKVA